MIRAALAATISLDRWLLLTVRRLESRAMTA